MKRVLFGLLALAAGFFSLSLVGDALHRARSGRSLAAALQAATSNAVAQAATTPVLSGALISGPASISTGACTAFTIVATDQNGRPIPVTQNVPVFLKLFSAASVTFSSTSSCSNSTRGFTIIAGASSKVFYAKDSKTESFLVQPILNPRTKPIYGTSFAFNFVGATPTPPRRTPTPTATSTPSGLKLNYWDGCWYNNRGSEYQALSFQLASPATLILQGELYNGAGCVAANWSDQFNDYNTAISFGGFGYIYWFTNRANLTDVSVIWTFSDTGNNLLWSSGCVDYSTAPAC
jgi:hypothetical protein